MDEKDLEKVKCNLCQKSDYHILFKKDGIIIVQTPDINTLIPKIIGFKSNHIMPRGHLYYFSRKSLKKMMFKTGFQYIEIYPTGRAPFQILKLLKIPTQSENSLNTLWVLCKVLGKLGLIGCPIVGKVQEKLASNR